MSDDKQRSGRILGLFGGVPSPRGDESPVPAEGAGAPAAQARPNDIPQRSAVAKTVSDAVARVRKDVKAHTVVLSQFMGIVESLAEDVPDESARYKVAAKVAKKTLDIEINDVLAEFDTVRDALQNAEKQLEAKLDRRAEDEVAGKRTELADLEAELQAQRDRVAALEKQASDLRTAITASEGKRDAEIADFAAARDAVLAEVDAQESRLKPLLGS
jgi:chromosome segregation ATPase